MKYPCEGCLVDPICVFTCDEFIWYLDALVMCSIPDWLIRNDTRQKRAKVTSILYHRNTSLHIDIVRAITRLEKKDYEI